MPASHTAMTTTFCRVALLKLISLHRNPAAASRVLDDVLTNLRKRHREAHRGARLQVQFPDQHRLRLDLDSVHHGVDVLVIA